MPEGILIIDWDEFEGGFVSYKYPEILIPDNLVQLLQISHSFNPGLITIQEDEFHALSIGIEELQKVIVLILTPYEDATDFTEVVHTISQVVEKIGDSAEQLENEIKKIFDLSQSVFKAREAVLNKLTMEVTDLKNRELDVKRSLQWLQLNQESLEMKVLLLLVQHRRLSFQNFLGYLNCSHDSLAQVIQILIKEKKIEQKNDEYKSLLHFLIFP